jgi:hypothetical protein
MERTGRQREIGRGLPDQNRDGVFVLRAHHADVGVGYLGSLELGPGLHYIELRGRAALVARGREAQEVGIGLNGVIEQPLLRIRRAQFEIVVGQLGVQAETGGCQIGSAGLRFFSRCIHGAADAAPEVHFI